jgi:hypothetical protein
MFLCVFYSAVHQKLWILSFPQALERRAEASIGGQAEEESTGGEDGQCDLEDELDLDVY